MVDVPSISPLMQPVVDAIVAGPRSGYASGRIIVPRPNDTTAYTAADIVGGVIRFPAMGPANGGEVMLTSWMFEIGETALVSTEAGYTLHLYNRAPPSALADNAPFALGASDLPFWLGSISLGTPAVVGSFVMTQGDSVNRQVTMTGPDLFGYLVTVAGYTPVALTQFIPSLHSALI